MNTNEKKNFETRLKDFSIEVENDKVTLSFKIPKEVEGKKVIPLNQVNLKEIPMIIPAKYRIPEERDDHHKEEENPVIKDYFMGDTIELPEEEEPGHENSSIKDVVTDMNNNIPLEASPKSKVVRVKISFKAYIKMALHALKYAHPDKPAHTWVEVIGFEC